jgi:DNA repair protein RadA
MESHSHNNSKSFITANEHHNNRIKSIGRISTGSGNLDNLLAGGIETEAVIEFYGESGSGKTQLCHTLCALVPQDRSEGGIPGKTIYIDTERKFRADRIIEITKARRLDPDDTLKNILLAQPNNSTQQESILDGIDIHTNNIHYLQHSC